MRVRQPGVSSRNDKQLTKPNPPPYGTTGTQHETRTGPRQRICRLALQRQLHDPTRATMNHDQTKRKKPGTPRKLTARQGRFAELVAAGMPVTTAYRKAGYSDTARVAEAHASRLVENGGVKARIAALRMSQTEEALSTLRHKRELCLRIMEDRTEKTADRLRAIELDAKLAGHFEPERIEVEAGGKALASIRERAAGVVSVLNAYANRAKESRERAKGLAMSFTRSHQS